MESCYKVVWSGELEKRQHDAAIRPAPSLDGESRPQIRIRNQANLTDISHVPEHAIDRQIVRAIRGKWGIKP